MPYKKSIVFGKSELFNSVDTFKEYNEFFWTFDFRNKFVVDALSRSGRQYEGGTWHSVKRYSVFNPNWLSSIRYFKKHVRPRLSFKDFDHTFITDYTYDNSKTTTWNNNNGKVLINALSVNQIHSLTSDNSNMLFWTHSGSNNLIEYNHEVRIDSDLSYSWTIARAYVEMFKIQGNDNTVIINISEDLLISARFSRTTLGGLFHISGSRNLVIVNLFNAKLKTSSTMSTFEWRGGAVEVGFHKNYEDYNDKKYNHMDNCIVVNLFGDRAEFEQ